MRYYLSSVQLTILILQSLHSSPIAFPCPSHRFLGGCPCPLGGPLFSSHQPPFSNWLRLELTWAPGVNRDFDLLSGHPLWLSAYIMPLLLAFSLFTILYNEVLVHINHCSCAAEKSALYFTFNLLLNWIKIEQDWMLSLCLALSMEIRDSNRLGPPLGPLSHLTGFFNWIHKFAEWSSYCTKRLQVWSMYVNYPQVISPLLC